MAGTNAFRDYLAAGAVNPAGMAAFNTANSYIGVGDSTTAFAATQTDLQAATNKLRKVSDTGFPTVSGNVVTFKSTFGTSEANFAWQEYGVFNAASAGTMMQRKVESLGTKTSAQAWTITVTNTLTMS